MYVPDRVIPYEPDTFSIPAKKRSNAQKLDDLEMELNELHSTMYLISLQLSAARLERWVMIVLLGILFVFIVVMR